MNEHTVNIVKKEALEHLASMYKDSFTGEYIDALRSYDVSREALAGHLADHYGSMYWLREDEQSKVEEALLADIDSRQPHKVEELSAQVFQLQAIDRLISDLSTRRRLVKEGTSWTKTGKDLKEAVSEHLEDFYYLLEEESDSE